MSLITIIIIGGIILLSIVVFKLIRNLIKAALYVLGIIFFATLIFGLIAYSDAREVSKIMKSGTKAVLYKGEEVITGAVLVPSDEIFSSITLPGEEAYDLTITVNEENFADKESFTINGKVMSKEAFNNIMHDQSTQDFEALKGALSDERFKAAVFLSAFWDRIEEEGTHYILESIKEETITIEPEFLTIKLIKKFPEKFFSSALNESIKRIDNGIYG